MLRISALKLVIGLVLVATATLLWTNRLPSETDFANLVNAERADADALQTGEAISACPSSGNTERWLIFILEANVFADTEPRGFFETAKDDSALLVRYEPSNREIGPSLVVELPGKNGAADFHLHTVRRSGEARVVFGVNGKSIRVVANGIDRLMTFPPGFQLDVSCASANLGIADGVPCERCDATVSYVSDLSGRRADQILDSFSNALSFRLKSVGSAVLAWFGIISLLVPRTLLMKLLKRNPTFGQERA
jgi:hypothetical protein